VIFVDVDVNVDVNVNVDVALNVDVDVNITLNGLKWTVWAHYVMVTTPFPRKQAVPLVAATREG
jgi:hypothetical protein